MSGDGRPQQPEIARSERTPIDPDHVTGIAAHTDHAETGDVGTGPVPPANRPGHHPDKEQDVPRALGGAGHGPGKRKH